MKKEKFQISLNKITVQNFKSIREPIEIQLQKFNVITGINGVGKSSILEAIKFCLTDNLTVENLENLNYFSIEPYIDQDQNKKMEIALNFIINENWFENFKTDIYNKKFLSENLVNFFNKFYGNEDESMNEFINYIKLNLIKNFTKNFFILEKESDELNNFECILKIECIEEENVKKIKLNLIKKFYLNLIETLFTNFLYEIKTYIDQKYTNYEEALIFLGTMEKEFKNYINLKIQSIFDEKILRDIKNTIVFWKYSEKDIWSNKYKWHKTEFNQALKENSVLNILFKMTSQSKLFDQNLDSAEINKIKNEININLNNKIQKYLKVYNNEIEIDIKRWENESGYGEGYTLDISIKTKNKFDNKQMSLESDGLKHFLSLISNLSLDEKENKILIIDEPEIHLHPGLIFDVKTFFENDLNEKNQIILTTHSPFFIDLETYDEKIKNYVTLFFDEKNNIKLEYKYLLKNEDFFKKSLNYNIYSKNEYPDITLFVEGKTDKIVLESLINKYDKTKNKKLVIFPTHGAGNISIFSAITYYVNEKYLYDNCFFLLDSDESGKKAKENLTNSKNSEYKNIDKNKVFSLNEFDSEMSVIEYLIDKEKEYKKGTLYKLKNDKNAYTSIVDKHPLDDSQKDFIEKLIEKINL